MEHLEIDKTQLEEYLSRYTNQDGIIAIPSDVFEELLYMSRVKYK